MHIYLYTQGHNYKYNLEDENKPFPIIKQMTLRDYVEYLSNIRNIENDIPKYERIINYNSKIDKIKLYEIDFDYKQIPQTFHNLNIVAEEERELAQASEGNLFGEMALIKNEPRNASIIALEKCYMISIATSQSYCDV